MSDEGDKKGGEVDLERRDFLRGGFFRRALSERREAQDEPLKERDIGGEAAPPDSAPPRQRVKPQPPVHKPKISAADAALSDEERVLLAQARARAMLGVVREPQEQRPFDIMSLIDMLDRPKKRAEAAKEAARAKVARIEQSQCLAYQSSFCTVCVERCPVPGAVLVREHRPQIQADLCTGCAECQRVCPAPINAIILEPVEVDS